jgi:hypothetical protein
MLSEAQIAEIKARTDLPSLAESLGAKLRRSGGKYVGSCPICGGGKSASRFEIKGAGWVCAVCPDGGDAIRLVQKATGCDFPEALRRLGGAAILSPEEEKRIADRARAAEAKRQAEAESYRQREIAAARRIWDEADPVRAQGAVAAYLAGRGLALPESAMLFEHAALPYYHGEALDERRQSRAALVHRGPAMVAAIFDNAGRVQGCHITWLEWRGAGARKLMLADMKTGEVLPAKKMRGSKAAGHIVLRSGWPESRRLFLAEGIETCLAVAAALRKAGQLRREDAFWAAGDLGNIGGKHAGTVPHPTAVTAAGRPLRVPGPEPDRDAPAITLPESLTHLVLLGDGDSEAFLTRTTLERARRRYARPGLAIAIAMAPEGADFNDVLVGEEVAA